MKKLSFEGLCVVLLALIAFGVCHVASHEVARVQAQNTPLKGKVIFIDAGHGGKDPGTLQGEEKESLINLTCALQLGETLQAKGATVVYSRQKDEGILPYAGAPWDKDEDMRLRVLAFEQSGADVVLSVHQNAFSDTTCAGPQVFYMQSESLAHCLQEALNKVSPHQNKRQKTYRDDLYLLKHTQKPIVIVEMAFMSNQKDLELIRESSYRQTLCDGIVEGLCLYFAP